MLNHNLIDRDKWPQLTLKQATHRNHLSRLMPCGRLEQKRNGLTCAVFMKRSRTHQSQSFQPTQPQKKVNAAGAGRIRSRRGSFLRLASIRSH